MYFEVEGERFSFFIFEPQPKRICFHSLDFTALPLTISKLLTTHSFTMRTLSLEILAALPFALAFSPTAIHRPSSRSIISNNLVDVSVISNIHGRRSATIISMASDDIAVSSQSSAPRKKRKRKDGQKFSPPPTTSDVTDDENAAEEASDEVAATVVPEEPKKTSVVMKVRDIRDIVSGAPEPEPIEEVEEEYVDDDDDELADDEEWEYYDVDEDGNEIISSNDDKTSDRTGDDSLEQLLADARSIRASSTESDGLSAEEETPIKDKIFDVISTIVTVDFFLVLGLLAWFLLGIFCSYVLKDDTVQIAFNMNFEKLTQPALGVLMIGSVAGSLGNKDEEEDSYL